MGGIFKQKYALKKKVDIEYLPLSHPFLGGIHNRKQVSAFPFI
jgi:hypothetical protein